MGYRVLDIQRVNLVDLGGFLRIELQVVCEIAGGLDCDEKAYGRIPTLANRVSAYGELANPVGDEGVSWPDPQF